MPPSVAASGNLSTPLKLTADLLAASETFQTLVGAADATEALESIYEGEAKGEDYPRCIIDWGERVARRNSTTGWSLEGDIAVLVQKEVPRSEYSTSYEDEGREFRNEMGDIESEILAALISSPSLYPNVIEINGPWVEHPDPDMHAGKLIFQGWMALSVEGAAV